MTRQTITEKRAAQQQAEDKQRKKAERQHQELLNAFKRVAKTPDGQIVLRWFMQCCGWKNLSAVLDAATKQIDKDKTLYNDARRYVWDAARKLIPWNLVNIIEAERNPKDEDEDDEPEI